MESTNSFYEALEQYQYARKLGKKQYKKDKKLNKSPYLKVLDDICNEYECSKEYIGEIQVPAQYIVGTKTNSRTKSFASNFMPLLDHNTEFGSKWCNLCEYHLSDSGLHDAPEVIEYLGEFFVVEGNKRVSVLKSYGAPLITCDVTRFLPKKTNDEKIINYYEFLDFYKLSKLYTFQFTKLRYYKLFQRLLGFEQDHVWTRMERIKAIGFFGRLDEELTKKNVTWNHYDCMVSMLEMYSFDYLEKMSDRELDKFISENKQRLAHGKGFYYIQCVSDEENIGLYSGCAKEELKNIDFIISAGDLKPEYLEFLVTMSNKPLFYVHGNHDDEYDVNPPGGCTCIDDDLIIYQGIRILGLGGSYRYNNSKYQYTEKQMERRIKKLRWKIFKAGGVDIVVTHAPIAGYGDLEDYAHQGFKCFEKLLKDLKPRFWFYGHVHLRYDPKLPRLYSVDKTLIINISDRYEVKY